MPVITKSKRIDLRVEDAVLDAWKAAADRAGLTLSNWIRLQCQAAIEAQTPTPKRKR